METNERRPVPIIAGLSLGLFMLFAAYMGGYYAMLTENERYTAVSTWVDIRKLPIYRVDTGIVDTLFMPANALDRLIRPGRWNDTVPLPGPQPTGPRT